MSAQNYDVVIVSGGMGGLHLAALLSHAGKVMRRTRLISQRSR
jgi:2-polyprenyl-6-methoxyphenol hydroxylase-like FAD-dependent oxidoreductase